MAIIIHRDISENSHFKLIQTAHTHTHARTHARTHIHTHRHAVYVCDQTRVLFILGLVECINVEVCDAVVRDKGI